MVELQKLPHNLSVCKVKSTIDINLNNEFYFVGKTSDEISVVCKTCDVPEATVAREDGWRAFVIQGVLDFSLVGILYKILEVLANAGIGIFAVSTYNTDYVLVKSKDYGNAEQALRDAGYPVV